MLVTKLGKESAGGMDASRTIEELDHQPAAERYNELSGGKVSAALAALKERSSSGRGGGGGDDDPNAGAVNIHIDAALAPLARESIDDHGTRHCQLIHPSALLPNSDHDLAEAKEQEELVLLVHSEGELSTPSRGLQRGRRLGVSSSVQLLLSLVVVGCRWLLLFCTKAQEYAV